MKTSKALLILAAAATASTAFAEKVPFNQLPPAVQQAIRQKAGRTQIEDIDREVRNGQVTYEASWKSGGSQQELLVSEAGTILRDVVGASTGLAQQNLTLANKVAIALTESPQAVQTAIQNQIPNAPVSQVQRGIWNGQNIYEVTYHDNGQLKTYQVTETGQPVVSNVPAGRFQPRYSGAAEQNVPLSAGAKMAFNSAPRPVQTTVQHLANGARIEDFERGQWNGRTVYQAAFKRNGQHTELQVFDDGTVVTKAPAGTIASAVTPGTGLSRTAASAPPSVKYAGLADANVQLSGGAKMNFNSAPRPVQNTIRQLAGNATVEDFERGMWNERVVYEAAFKRNGQHTEVQVLDDGSVLTKQLPTAAGAPAPGTIGAGQQ
jgi:uncharacterized membrane protein YkoI